MRILYVEDDDALAVAIERMLAQAAHSCDRVSTGRDAVTLGQANDYDLILLDVMLPDFDGYEVLRRLRSAGVRTPFLIQSGLVERDKAMAGQGFGVEDFLIKPFNRDELIRGVERVAARRQAAEPVRSNGTAAEIINDGDGSAIRCTIVSVTSSGAVVELRDETARCADTFMLVVPGDKGYRCEACWQHGGKIGVAFA